MQIDLANPIYFYNSNGCSDYFYKLKTILYLDDELCLCVAGCLTYLESSSLENNLIQPHQFKDEKLLFNLYNGVCTNYEDCAWRATNDLSLVKSYLIY